MSLFLYTCVLYVLMMLGFDKHCNHMSQKRAISQESQESLIGESYRRAQGSCFGSPRTKLTNPLLFLQLTILQGLHCHRDHPFSFHSLDVSGGEKTSFSWYLPSPRLLMLLHTLYLLLAFRSFGGGGYSSEPLPPNRVSRTTKLMAI